MLDTGHLSTSTPPLKKQPLHHSLMRCIFPSPPLFWRAATPGTCVRLKDKRRWGSPCTRLPCLLLLLCQLAMTNRTSVPRYPPLVVAQRVTSQTKSKSHPFINGCVHCCPTPLPLPLLWLLGRARICRRGPHRRMTTLPSFAREVRFDTTALPAQSACLRSMFMF